MSTSQDIILNASDGFKLAATHLEPARAARCADGRDAWLLMGSATGVPRGFYRKFAEAAAARGLHVLCTDYRGVGDSKPSNFQGSLKGFDMQYADWSRLDLAAAHTWAADRGQVWLVGHSLAAHAIGQLPRVRELKAALVCGGGAGWHGYMPPLEQVKAQLLWRVLGPISTRLKGYFPMKALGMGEDLPMGVYRDWQRWCGFPNYFFDDPREAGMAQAFAEVRIPVGAMNATDDLWAMPASRDAFFKHFTGTQVDTIDLDPAQFSRKAIGHMGYFRQAVGRTLWPRMFAWLEQHELPISTAFEGKLSVALA